MLYLTNLIRFPYTGSLQSQPGSGTKFSASFDPTKVYKWTFSKALNECADEVLLDYKEDELTLLFNGLLENPDKKYLKFNFDIRIRLSNSTDFSLATCSFVTTSIHNIVNKKLKLNSMLKEFKFQPYKDIIYITMNVKNNKDETDTSKINLDFDTFGFDLLKHQ